MTAKSGVKRWGQIQKHDPRTPTNTTRRHTHEIRGFCFVLFRVSSLIVFAHAFQSHQFRFRPRHTPGETNDHEKISSPTDIAFGRRNSTDAIRSEERRVG